MSTTMTADRSGRAGRARALPVRFLHAGSARHGVTRFGLQLADAVRATGNARVLSERVTLAARQPRLEGPDGGRGGRVITHLQFSDSLWGVDVATAADTLLRAVERLDGPVVVTLHDLPDPQDPPDRWRRRARAYAAVARRADAVVVSSAHEAERLHLAAPDVTAAVVGNPVPDLSAPDPGGVRLPAVAARPASDPRVVGVLGWVFPGKGHEDVLRALPGGGDAQVLAMGAVARGHRDDTAALRRLARRNGVPFTVTGWLEDAKQLQLMRQVDVPVAPQARPSASGSMLAWIAAGRRPLVCRSPYAEELAARAPACLTLYDRPDLAERLQDALTRVEEPPPPVPVELSTATAAARHLHLYGQL